MLFYQARVCTIANILLKYSECQTGEFLGDKEPLFAEHACVPLSVQIRFFFSCIVSAILTCNSELLTINTLILLHSTISPPPASEDHRDV